MAVWLFVPAKASLAQLPKSASTASTSPQPTQKLDPLGRETPRSTMMNALKAGQRRDFAAAALYM
ncbi:MAG: hypothetical protein WB950_02275, partial [Acidobacteriaceae bacterium]